MTKWIHKMVGQKRVDKATLTQMREEGKTWKEIAQTFKIVPETLQNWRKKNNLPVGKGKGSQGEWRMDWGAKPQGGGRGLNLDLSKEKE